MLARNKEMSKQSFETSEQAYERRLGKANAYSARVQEAMRYNKLRSADYPLVMTILEAVSRGSSEEQWKEEQRAVKLLAEQPADKSLAHADEVNRYEQTVYRLKDLTLWPW